MPQRVGCKGCVKGVLEECATKSVLLRYYACKLLLMPQLFESNPYFNLKNVFIHYSNEVLEETSFDQHASTSGLEKSTSGNREEVAGDEKSQHLVFEKNSEKEIEILCEQCNKTFLPKVILRHISNSMVCKKFYGPRLNELKKQNATKRKRKLRNDLKIKEEELKAKHQLEKEILEKNIWI